jgi:hypothetical protein
MTTPLTWIEAPARTPRPNRSLDVIPVEDVSGEHFIGFEYVADPCVFPNPVPQDCYVQIGPAAGSSKSFGSPNDWVATEVFGAYQGIECFLNGGIDDFQAIAQRVLEAGDHHVVDGAITAMLSAGSGTALTPPTSDVRGAIAALEQQLAEQVPGMGYIFLSPLVATYAIADHLLDDDDMNHGALTTHLGTPVVILTEASMKAVAYASGPINVWRGPVTVAQGPDLTHNKGSALAERLYSVAIECGMWQVNVPTPGTTDCPDCDPAASAITYSPPSPVHLDDVLDVTVVFNTPQATPPQLWVNWGPSGWMHDVDFGTDVNGDGLTWENSFFQIGLTGKVGAWLIQARSVDGTEMGPETPIYIIQERSIPSVPNMNPPSPTGAGVDVTFSTYVDVAQATAPDLLVDVNSDGGPQNMATLATDVNGDGKTWEGVLNSDAVGAGTHLVYAQLTDGSTVTSTAIQWVIT